MLRRLSKAAANGAAVPGCCPLPDPRCFGGFGHPQPKRGTRRREPKRVPLDRRWWTGRDPSVPEPTPHGRAPSTYRRGLLPPGPATPMA